MNKLPFLLLFLFSSYIAFAQDEEPKEELKPTKTEALVTVHVENNAGEASVGDKVTFVSEADDSVSFFGISGDDGKFQVLLPKATNYKVKVQFFGGFEDYARLPIPDTTAAVYFEFKIKYELPKVYKLESVYFESARSQLKPASFPSLRNLAEIMVNKKKLVIEVGGHTDDVGDDSYNQKLSEQRAMAVKSFLVKRGVDAERVKAVGYGESMPVVPNDTPEGRQQNRRTEVKILSN